MKKLANLSLVFGLVLSVLPIIYIQSAVASGADSGVLGALVFVPIGFLMLIFGAAALVILHIRKNRN